MDLTDASFLLFLGCELWFPGFLLGHGCGWTSGVWYGGVPYSGFHLGQCRLIVQAIRLSWCGRARLVSEGFLGCSCGLLCENVGIEQGEKLRGTI